MMTLKDGMDMIDKKHWLIREPQKQHQWTFILGTNWTKFPEFRKLGIYAMGTPEGKKVLDKLNLTQKELESEKFKDSVD